MLLAAPLAGPAPQGARGRPSHRDPAQAAAPRETAAVRARVPFPALGRAAAAAQVRVQVALAAASPLEADGRPRPRGRKRGSPLQAAQWGRPRLQLARARASRRVWRLVLLAHRQHGPRRRTSLGAIPHLRVPPCQRGHPRRRHLAQDHNNRQHTLNHYCSICCRSSSNRSSSHRHRRPSSSHHSSHHSSRRSSSNRSCKYCSSARWSSTSSSTSSCRRNNKSRQHHHSRPIRRRRRISSSTKCRTNSIGTTNRSRPCRKLCSRHSSRRRCYCNRRSRRSINRSSTLHNITNHLVMHSNHHRTLNCTHSSKPNSWRRMLASSTIR